MNATMTNGPTLIIIAGPTAIGKTAVAIEVARQLGTQIISADSRQCYQEMNIGVARPTPKELSLVPHHFIASHSIHQPVNAAYFEGYALGLLQQLFKQHKHVVAVGGTGLYLKALMQGLDEMPEVPTAIREQVRQQYEQFGLPWLQQNLLANDPDYAQTGEMQNPHRLLRALEIFLTTGKSIRHFQQAQPKQRPFSTSYYVLTTPRPHLYQRINQRVQQMVVQGLEEEARSLYPYKHLQPLQTVGYQEYFDCFDGKLTNTQAIEAIAQHTRNYAKRQITWFSKVPDAMQVSITTPVETAKYILQKLAVSV